MSHTHQHVPTSSRESVVQFFERLFDADFVPRFQCVNERTDLLWLHVVSDAIISLAYYSIPLALIYFVRKRRDLDFNWMYVMFAAFIVACGTTHLISVAAFWEPMYRLDGVVKAATAGVSIITALLLWPLVPHALAIPSPAQLARANADLAREVAERRRAQEDLGRSRNELEQRVLERTATLAAEVAERRKAEEHRSLLMAELDHRVKNNLSTVLSIAEQTLLVSGSLEEFSRSFVGRVRALAETHGALAKGHWEGASVGALVEQVLAPHIHGDGGNVSISGSEVMLGPKAAASLTMAIHELATNAAKYGAFSSPQGHVSVSWSCEPESQDRSVLQLVWQERGGPPVTVPTRRGLGSVIIDGAIRYELKGSVRIEYPQEGLRATLRIPIPTATRAGAPPAPPAPPTGAATNGVSS
jgi:two-component sensor histidine kinase